MIASVAAPRINTNDDQVEVVAWHVAPGARVEAGQPVVDLETAKTAVTLDAESGGYVRPLVEKGTVLKVGEPIYLLAATPQALERGSSATSAAESSGGSAATRFSKDAERLMQEHGLSAADFEGKGLVTAKTVRERLDSGNATKPPSPAAPNSGPAAARSERLSLTKQAEIESLAQGESGNINSMLSIAFDSARIRERLLDSQSFGGSIQPVILFETVRLLKNYPALTAYCDGGRIHYYDRVDLGLAFDLGKGLKVVTIKGAAALTPLDIFEKTIDIGLRYLDNRLAAEELAGSTFTVTDLSGMNILHFHPLINGHQSAIIGLGGDASRPGHPMAINLTFDHRVTNGREVAAFLNELRARILSYAPDKSAAAPQAVQPFFSAATEAPEIRCDRCLIDLPAYYKKFPRDACMTPYFREDGSMGGMCHRCAGGWI